MLSWPIKLSVKLADVLRSGCDASSPTRARFVPSGLLFSFVVKIKNRIYTTGNVPEPIKNLDPIEVSAAGGSDWCNNTIASLPRLLVFRASQVSQEWSLVSFGSFIWRNLRLRGSLTLSRSSQR